MKRILRNRFEWLFLRNSTASASSRVPRSLSKRGRNISIGFRNLIFFEKRFLKPTNLKGEGLIYENWNVTEKIEKENKREDETNESGFGSGGVEAALIEFRSKLLHLHFRRHFYLKRETVVLLHYRFSILKKRVNRVGVLYTMPFLQWLRCAL